MGEGNTKGILRRINKELIKKNVMEYVDYGVKSYQSIRRDINVL